MAGDLRRILLFLGCAWLLSGCQLGPLPQTTAPTVAAAPSTTSSLLLEAAKNDQRSFEIFRRSTYPLALPILSGSFTCAERIGLYCMDQVMGGLARIRVVEDSTVVRAREQLIRSLTAANQRMPGDGWVQGQLVRYLVESGDFLSASASAANCRVTPFWWCFALAGYVYHHAGLPGPAEGAFHAALAAMPEEERFHWLDLSPLLDPEVAAEYALLDPATLLHFEERFWKLADPLLTQPGNELLNAHLSRWVELTFQLDSETAEGPLLERDALETIGRYDLLLRYGLPTHWIRGLGKMGRVEIHSRTESPYCAGGPTDCGALNYLYTVQGVESGEFAYLRGHFDARIPPNIGPGTGVLAPPMGVRDLIASYEVSSQDLLPPSASLLSVTDGEEDQEGVEWDSIQEIPQTAYTLPMESGAAHWIAPLASQFAVFPRGDSAMVVASWDLTAHGLPDSVRVDAGIALLPTDNLLAPVAMEVADATAVSGALAVMTAAHPSLLSIEAVVPEALTMSRARQSLALAPLPPTRFAISDLLLLQGGEEEVHSLEEAVAVARGSARVSPDELLGVYWEIYGLDPAISAEVRMSFALHRTPPGAMGGAFRWLGQAMGLVEDDTLIRTEWGEEVVAGAWMGRSLTVQVPDLSEGSYTLILTATVPGREPVVAVRNLEVTRSVLPPPTMGTLIRRPNLTRPTRCLPETSLLESAFSVVDARDYLRTPRCAYSPDPAWFGHYGGSENLKEYGYEGW